MGGSNLVLETRDSINRMATSYEANARRILKDIMYDINLRDCYRESNPTGGFTWKSSEARGDIMSRLDMILLSA